MSTQQLAELYTQGDLILKNPIESSSIFLIVVVVCASVEYLFSLAGKVDSRFFQQFFKVISEEVLVVGVLSLLLTFGASLIVNLPSEWSTMFDWAHVCLLFMGIFLVLFLCLTVLSVMSTNSRWQKFESQHSRDPIASLSGGEKRFRLARDKFLISLAAHEIESDASFAHYLLKAEKKNLLSLADLTWKTWLALSAIVVLNALRTRLIPKDGAPSSGDILDDTGNLLNVATYVLICGYAPLFGLIYIHYQLQRRYDQYVNLAHQTASDDQPDQPLVKRDLDDSQSFLLWQSHDSTMALVQAIFMIFVWYTAVFCINMMYRTFTMNIEYTILILVVGTAPLIAFLVMLPWLLTAVAVLSSLGTSLCIDWARTSALDPETHVVLPKGGGGDEPAAERKLAPVVL